MFSVLQKKIASPVLYTFPIKHLSLTSINCNTSVGIPFAKAKEGSFVQDAPHLENSFEGDAFLKRNLERLLPNEVYSDVKKELSVFGARVATDIYRLGRECELNPPYMKLKDAWANPHNRVVTCESWKELKRLSAREGIVALAYERNPKHQGFSRLIQMSKNYLYYPSSGLYSCPLAMTDGAAKTLEVSGLKDHEAYRNLTSRDPERFWTSGQWMTEKRGGSDVAGGTETLAVQDPSSKNMYRLYGYKFFSSATDADVALTLARIVDPSTGKTTAGTRGLSLFLVHVDQPSNLHLIRLKEKLGTKQLPTGELLLDGMNAELLSPPGRGVASISHMLNITRLHNASGSVSAMRRIISLARDYSNRRVAFGKPIRNHPLHVRTLADMELECRAGFILFAEAARLLSLEESGAASNDQQQLLRLLLPLLKLYTGKQCIKVVSEGLESFGGQGYMEDTGIPVILRDAQVTPIWEGTTNILSLDVLRAVAKTEGQVLIAYYQRIQGVLDSSANPSLSECYSLLERYRSQLLSFAQNNPDKLEYVARDFAFGLARTLAGALLLEHASWSGAVESDVAAAERWLTQRDLVAQSLVVEQISNRCLTSFQKLDEALVFDGYDAKHLLSPLF
ncbi:acyl-CoA dehydrogenase family member 11-like [Daphnia carinata]|uniref:acyl-CoA dehydrogenase family member 11-like n=1 Tax=Daphnia carinata TaxID=120202 RepID=UPI002580A7EC|nr:acyl-CoA dehydrogenase family member 11-like [Daphnia carinata]